MTVITKEFLAALRVEMNQALAAVAQKHNIAIAAGNCSFGASDATFKLLITTNAAPGASGLDLMAAKAKSQWESAHWLCGIRKDALGQTFTFAGRTYKVEGFQPAKKNPFLCSRDGKYFSLPVDYLRAAFGEKEPA